MNKVIKLTKGLNIPFTGAAAEEVRSVSLPQVYSIVPDHFAGITPKLDVKEGDAVKAGSPLFHSKACADMMFASPVSGRVLAINRGERRKIMSITIEADAEQTYEQYDFAAAKDGAAVKALLLKAGVWSYIKQRPYDLIANPAVQPKVIFISTFDSAPVAPNYEFVLAKEGAALQNAINALAKIATVFIGIDNKANATLFRGLKNCQQVLIEGPHPAGNVGVQINHVCPIAKGETVYTINIQDLAIIGRLFTKGIVDMSKLVALTGPLACTRAYYRVLPGVSAEAVLKSNVQNGEKARLVEGNVLSGHQIQEADILSPYTNQLTILAEGDEANEFMGWAMPRFNMFSNTNMFFSKILQKLGKKDFAWDARLKGGRRAIIVSGEYDRVFPMDIYPEYLLKAMIAGNLDKMEQLGAYEVAPEDFALCEFVCTSKMPLQAIVREALNNMHKELE